MISRVMDSYTHWYDKKGRFHFGFRLRGSYHVFRYKRDVYYTCIVYTFWRFFLSVDRDLSCKYNEVK